MFTGGELSEDAIEGAYKALTDAYWIAKENNKKYAPKTRRKNAAVPETLLKLQGSLVSMSCFVKTSVP